MLVKKEIDVTCAHTGELSHHDVLCDSTQHLFFSIECSVVEHVHCFLEGTSQKRPRLNTINSMAVDGHQMAMHCHHIHETCKVAIVDVGTIEGNNVAQFAQNRRANTLDSQHRKDFNDVVRYRPASVDMFDAEN